MLPHAIALLALFTAKSPSFVVIFSIIPGAVSALVLFIYGFSY
jgi:hypothetical protein